MAKGYLTWNTCTEEQRAIIVERLGHRVAHDVATTKGGAYPLFSAIRYNGFHHLYSRYRPGYGFERGPMTVELINNIILKVFDDIDFGNIEFQLKD